MVDETRMFCRVSRLKKFVPRREKARTSNPRKISTHRRMTRMKTLRNLGFII